MAGDQDGDVLRRDTSPCRTSSRAGSSSTSQPQEGHQREQPIPQQNPLAVPAHESKEVRNAPESIPHSLSGNISGTSGALDPKRVSWAAMAARGTTAKNLSMRSTSRGNTPSLAANMTAMQNPSSGRVAPPAPARVDEIREQDTTSMPFPRDPSASHRRGSGPRHTATSPPQPDSSTLEDDSRSGHPAEHERLQALRSYLGELAEAHDLPRALVEHLSDEESETTLTTLEMLFKNFASRLSEECRDRDKDLQSTKLKLEMSTSAQAALEKEKSALEEAARMKDAELQELSAVAKQVRESNVEDLEAQIESCVIERDEAISELRELRKKLKEAEDERNEKEIATQKLHFALEEARQVAQQAAPSVDVEALRATISDLHEELRGVKSDKAELEREAERTTAARKRKDDETAAQLAHQDELLQGMQDKSDKYKELTQALQHEKEEQLRKASGAEKEREAITFRVDNEIMPREKYEKLLDNARGDIANLQERLQQAEAERENIIQEELSVDEVRKMVTQDIVPLYALATDEAAQNLFNTWGAENARLLALSGEDGYRKYLHAIVESDHGPSRTSSEGFVTRGEAAAGLGLYGSQGSEPTSPPVRQDLESELRDFSRESSMAPEDSQIGQGDGSAELLKALDECQIHRKEADQRIEELMDETKKQKDEIEVLQDEIQKLKEAAEDSGDSGEEPDASEYGIRTPTHVVADHGDVAKPDEQQPQGGLAVELRDMQAGLDECQAHRKKADNEIEKLKAEARRRSRELRKLEGKLSLQQRVGELLKEQIGAVQAKASKAKAKAKWAEARVILQREGADDEEASSSSINDPEGYLELLSTLSQRVEEAECQFSKRHQELADARTVAATLRVTIEELETQRGQLEQERKQLWEELKVHSGSEQGNTVLEKELEKNQELREKDGDIEEKNEEVRKTKEELDRKMEELPEKKKALDDCRAHDEDLIEKLAALAEHQEDESEEHDSQDGDRQKEIDRLEKQVADLEQKVKAAEFNASNEAARRREVEENGVWAGTRAAALKSKQTELDNFKKEHDDTVQLYEADIKALKDRIGVAHDDELERVRLEHQRTADELEAQLRTAEEKSRGHAVEMERIKLEHKEAMIKLESKLDASDIMLEILQDQLCKPLDTEEILRLKPVDSATQTDETPVEEATPPTDHAIKGPTEAYLTAYFKFKGSIESGLHLQDTATEIQDYQLRLAERLDQDLARRIYLSRYPIPSKTTSSPPETPDSQSDDEGHSSPLEDHVPGSPATAFATDEEDERAATLRAIRKTCDGFEDLRVRKERYEDDEAPAIQLLFALEAEIAALKKRLEGGGGNGAGHAEEAGEADDSDEKTVVPGSSDGESSDEDSSDEDSSDDDSSDDDSSDDDSSDDDEQDPGKDPAAIRRRIARLRRKVSKTAKNLKKDEETLRSEIEQHEADLADWIDDLDDLDDDPERTLYRYLIQGTEKTAEAGYWKGSKFIRPMPLPPFAVFQVMSQRGPGKQEKRPRVEGFPELDTLIPAVDPDGDGDPTPSRLRPQEALVRRIQKELGGLRLYAEACEDGLYRINRAAEDLMPVDDPVPRSRARSWRPTSPLPSRAATLRERAKYGEEEGEEEEEEDRRAVVRDMVYEDLASEPSSIASGDVSGDDGNPNRILKSVIPKTVHDALHLWKVRTGRVFDRIETLQDAVEGLIDTGVNSQHYDCLRGRIRRLRKDLADASATNAKLTARLSRGSAEGTDGELQETIRTLRHENNALREQSRVAEQAIRDRGAREGRQRQLEQEVVAARARTEVEKTKNKTLAEEKGRLQRAVERMEKSRKEAIRDGLDREMRETLFDYEELKKKATGLAEEVANLRERLSNEFLTRSAQLETAQVVIRGMAGRLEESQRRAEVAEDMRATLVTDVERALDIEAGDDARSLARTRRRISNILCRVKEEPGEADGRHGENAGDGEGAEHERAMEEYNPNTERERELVQKILDERTKGAEALAAEKRAHEERTNARRAECEKQARDWQDMYDAAEAARKLLNSNLVEAAERIRVLEVEAGWLKRANDALDEKLKEQCTANQEMIEELYGASDGDGDGEDGPGGGGGTAGGHEGGPGDAGDGPGLGGVEQPSRKPRQPRQPREPQEQPGGAAGGDPGDGPGDSSSSDGSGSDGSDSTIRGRQRCACPCVGLCDNPVNPVYEDLPAGAQGLIRKLRRVYETYRACCGRRGGGATALAAAAAAAAEEPAEDDGLLLWRLMGIMRGDADIREQMRNAERSYAARLLLAFWSCVRVHALSWGQSAWWAGLGLAYYAAFFLPESRWKPGPPAAPPPKRVAVVVKDALLLWLLYYTYRVLAATWAAQRIWEVANGYTRAYFIERGLHPERSRWFGLDGVDMRLRGSGTPPYSTASGHGATG